MNGRPSQEELRAEADWVQEIEALAPGNMSEGNKTTVKVAERLRRKRERLRHTARRMQGLTPMGPPDAEELIYSAML